MNKHPLLNFLGTSSLNILWQASNSSLLGIPEALKQTIANTYTQSKRTNEALYCLQIKTFLETVDLTEDEVNSFMKKHPDHQRLGFEIFKILENTILEKQAKMLANTFRLYTQENIARKDFDQYVYIITRLDNHLINLIEILFKNGVDFKPVMTNNSNHKIKAIGSGITSSFPSPNMDLVNF